MHKRNNRKTASQVIAGLCPKSVRNYLNVFGQYSLNGQRNSKMGYMVPDLYMQSHFGGTLDYMFNDKFGITGGAVHEFNPIKGHWETTPVFGPVIHLKKK
ncbi:hypothetical protein PDM24_11295 [Bacteroides fragilis]|uniref:hypothetical protein n=1 Tax=uncultured Bacteroides sp. TaxID=162156 RepID=UPI0015F5CFBF|nr:MULTISPECIES: hypothetical protein [Bacteroides]MBC5611533.1 hypothetical protein [Bacteroides hominis (ex Liu et al. 2022)]MCE8557024.1 hypothetical protein [Bacteroides fragilis]MCM0225204.1 hypothetical protein [Bacteroides fragilis]MCM0259422.1 hypothetical protein [Bacteroides fragilis]MCM0295715.1 hypothetical protein [Bacteroides fragilis]